MEPKLESSLYPLVNRYSVWSLALRIH